MNGSEPKFNSEYVEIMTALENIRTRMERIESLLRESHQETTLISAQVNWQRTELARMKATAAVIGGIAGSAIAMISRYFLTAK